MRSITLKIGIITFHDQLTSLNYFFSLPLSLTNGKENLIYGDRSLQKTAGHFSEAIYPHINSYCQANRLCYPEIPIKKRLYCPQFTFLSSFFLLIYVTWEPWRLQNCDQS